MRKRSRLNLVKKELFGFYLTEHPMAKNLQLVSKQANKKINDLDGSIHEGQIFTIGGILIWMGL